MHRLIVPLLAGLGLAVLSAPGAATQERQAACHPTPAAAAAQLRAALAHGRFVAYQPTALAVYDGRVRSADAASIRTDLELLRPHFDSLITYDAIHGGEHVASVASALKFRALIIGVWNPLDEAQLRAASDAARRYPRLVVGVSLGNELIFSHRSDPQALRALLVRLRERLRETPLSVSEPFHIYGQEQVSSLLEELDFLLPIVHPLFQRWFPEAPDSVAAQFVVNVVHTLGKSYCGPILVKETGVPTAPASARFSEDRQASFYRELRNRFPPSREAAFAYFAAFDAPWRAYDATAVPGAPAGVHPEEAHWGLYDADRSPKRAARELPPLTSPPSPP
jgi:exo-beta-1,3-glucanase (GH17 family)